MKKIFSFLFALLFMAGTTGVFTSCQEDAPEINYTLNVTVNNDFTEVVNAMKQEAAIAALTAAINGVNGSEPVKLDALIEAINKLASTIDAKLVVLEAAMKAQTLALEAKLGLLETAIKALPDYTEKLGALEAAIKALPDYSTKLAALETAIKNIPDYGTQLKAIADAIPTIPEYGDQITALELALTAIAENIKAQEGQYEDELAALTASIDAIKAAVEAGNLSEEEALAKILALLEGIDTAVNPDYVTFTADKPQTLTYTGSDLQYSTDGITFKHLSANTPVTFGGDDILYLRGVDNMDGTEEYNISYENYLCRFSL